MSLTPTIDGVHRMAKVYRAKVGHNPKRIIVGKLFADRLRKELEATLEMRPIKDGEIERARKMMDYDRAPMYFIGIPVEVQE